MLAEDSFCKDGRKISVGDCALFQAGDSPPFIGLIRWLTSGKEDYLKLGVNWLYRPADIKLGKGILLEAAPNEVFYSFHKDEIPAASLLHPCKVSFLRKGVELPSGISSFICRRVYDIANKCLWWLTDQDYINDRQEEVDLLLDKTQIEMHAAVQSGGRSPKPLNGPTSAQQLKSGSDSVQNSTVSCPPQVKGKKRERGEQGQEPIKRERSLKTDDGDSSHFKPEIMLKAEIAKITDNGGLINFEGVEKLVYLMQLDRAEKKIDLAGRIMISNVIAATDNIDCLSRFVQLRGVPVLDDWLQEVHKGKIGDSNSPKEGDKAVEELLLALLHALDKLPVNLNALQTCNIGKSVNHLRSHKNLEIHKKARSLVDMWKKGVEAEMKINESKSGSNQTVSWPGKPGFSDISHGVNKRAGSSEVTPKSLVAQPSAAKMAPIKLGHGDAVAKSTLVSPGSIKLSSKAGSVGTSEVPLTAIKEEKSSSSSQSQNNSQSCSSDHAIKTSSGVSRHRKSSNGFTGSGVSGVQKENALGKSCSSTRNNPASDKVSQSALTSERAVEIPSPDHGNSHRLIVRLPNPVRSPAQSASGGSPVVSEKHDHYDRKIKGKIDTYRCNISADVNTESWQSNYVKDGLVGSDEGERSPPAVIDEEHSKTNDEGNGKEMLTEAKLRKLCEASASLSGRDDIGMNLLASVAAGEMSKSDPVSPTGSPVRNSPVLGEKLILSQEDVAHGNMQDDDCADDDFEKQDNNSAHSLGVSNGFPQVSTHAMTTVSGNSKNILPFSEHVSASKKSEHLPASDRDLPQTAEPCLKARGKLDEVTMADKREESSEGEVADQFNKKGKKIVSGEKFDGSVTNIKSKARSLSSDEDKTVDSAHEKITESGVMPASNIVHGSLGDGCDIEDAAALLKKIDKEALEESPSCSSLAVNNENASIIPNGSGGDVSTEQQLPLVAPNPMDISEDAVAHSSSGNVLCPRNVDESRTENELVDQRTDKTSLVSPVLGDRVGTSAGSLVLEYKNSDGVKEESGRVVELKDSPTFPVQEGEQSMKSTVSKLSGIEVDEMEECASTAEASSFATTATGSDMTAKLDFDLNEGLGFPVDEGNQVGCSSAVHLPNPVPSITVASPAIGPFVPPENLLRSKGEFGWKGSAATSAFRPAEPRKNLEMLLTTNDIPSSDTTAAKQSRLTLDIDLNVADERVIEDVANNNHDLGHIGIFGSPAARPVLDLNQADESMDNGQFLASSSRRLELPLLPNSEVNILRDFDLNNGPNLDETGPESSLRNQHAKNSNIPFLSSVNGPRINNTELVGGLSTWFPPGNSYPLVANPGAQRMLGSGASGSNFIGDLYRGGPVLSSSPAIAFPYAGFPFGTSFPLSTTTAYMDSSSGVGPLYQHVASQLVGPAGGVSSHYSRPYVINLPEGSSSSGGVESSRKWVRPGLDLNAGPGNLDMDGRDDRLKRKEPEGGWDLERFYRQPSWQ